jgi:hypothetical protein
MLACELCGGAAALALLEPLIQRVEVEPGDASLQGADVAA